jgi:hypothetical protein
MTITPFLTLKLRKKKDAILARQRARRVANLLGFDLHEQTCVAAGTFVIACQALSLYPQARLCFQIEKHQLQVFAQEAAGEVVSSEKGRLAGMFPELDAKSLYRLTKALPAEQRTTEEKDLGWLVRQVEATACGSAFEEMMRQNQEVLALLHEVRLCRLELQSKEGRTPDSRAA